MTPRRPTILDVARKAGVSKSTVSLVLQGAASVRPETARAVREAMTALDYVYNRAAANLRGSATGLVGLVINDLRNPFFTEFAAAAQMAFAKAGFATVIGNTDEDAGLQDQVIASMVEHGVAAVVISSAYGGTEDGFARLGRSGVPVLQVLRRGEGPGGLRFPFLAPDYAAGGRLATEHLIAQGSQRIAFVGGLEARPVTLERMAGYSDVMTEAGLASLVRPGRPSRGFGRLSAQALIAEGIEAAVCFSDLVALGMLAGLMASGVEPGRDFHLVGFDDIEESALAFPQLSSVRCDSAGLGRLAAATILDWLAGGIRPPDETRTPVSLVTRRSSTGKA